MKKSVINNRSLRNLVLATLASLPIAGTLKATLPSTAAVNLTAPSTVTTVTDTTSSAVTDFLTITVSGSSKSNTILQWQAFNLGWTGGASTAKQEKIDFVLPTADSAVLNKVVGGASTTIDNAWINSNGRVFFYNPNGITLSGTAKVTAAKFVATTLADTDMDSKFIADGDLSYTGASTGALKVTANANISVLDQSGEIVLAGAATSVSGTITGNLTVRSASTGSVALGFDGAAAAALTVNKWGTAGGNVTVVSNGAAVALSNTSAVTSQGNITVNSSNGAVTSGAGVITGKTLEITAGTGAVTLTAANNALDTLKVNSAASLAYKDADNIAIDNSTVAGAVNITSNAGAISMVSGAKVNMAVNATATLIATDATKAITFAAAGDAVSFATTGNVVTLSNTGNANFTVAAPGALTSLSVTSSAGSVTNASAAAIISTGNVTLNGKLGVTTATSINSGGNIAITADSGSIVFGGALVSTNAPGAAATVVSITSSGDIALPSVTATGSAFANVSIKSTAGSITQAAGTYVSNTGTATIDANKAITLTNYVLGTAGTAESAAGANDGVNGTATAGNKFNVVVLKNATASSAVAISDIDGGVILGSGSSVLGDATVTAYDNVFTGIADDADTAGVNESIYADATADSVVLGNSASATLSFGKLTLNSSSTDAAGTASVSVSAATITTGNLVFNTAKAVDLTGGTTSTFGSLSGTVGGNLSVTEQSILDFGTISITGTLTAKSTAGITDSGVITTTGVSTFDIITGTGDIILDSANLFANVAGSVTVGASGRTANVTVTNAQALQLGAVTATGNAKLETTATGSNITQNAALAVTGTTTLATTGTSAVTLNTAGNKIATLTLATAGTGAVTVADSFGDLVVNGTSAGALTINSVGALNFAASVTGGKDATITASQGDITVAGSSVGETALGNSTGGNFSFTAQDGNIVLGSFYSQFGTLTLDAKTTDGKTITDLAGARANVYGNVTFLTKNGAITIDNFTDLATPTNTGHTFGGITAKTVTTGADAGAAINIAEDMSLRIVDIEAGAAAINLTATGTGSNIIGSAGKVATTTLITTGDVKLQANTNVSLTESGGDALTVTIGGKLYSFANTNVGTTDLGTALGGTTGVTVTGQISIVTGGYAKLYNNKATLLGGTAGVGTGDFYVGGDFTLNASGAVTQASGILLRTKGLTTINAAGFDITLDTNSTNEFGPVLLTGNTVKIKESGTLNFGTLASGASTVTTLTATSVNGNIMDTGALTATTATFSAANGSITLGSAADSFGTLTISACKGDATITDSSAGLTLKTSTVTGSLTINSTAGGAISAAADQALTIGGSTTFNNTTAGGTLSLLSTNSFGELTFKVGGAVTINEAADMVLAGGNSATGLVTLTTSAGDIRTSTTSTALSTFSNQVQLQAAGNVTVLSAWNIAGSGGVGLTVRAAGGSVNLSGLSLSQNLAGIAPTLVQGSYVTGGNPTN